MQGPPLPVDRVPLERRPVVVVGVRPGRRRPRWRPRRPWPAGPPRAPRGRASGWCRGPGRRSSGAASRRCGRTSPAPSCGRRSATRTPRGRCGSGSPDAARPARTSGPLPRPSGRACRAGRAAGCTAEHCVQPLSFPQIRADPRTRSRARGGATRPPNGPAVNAPARGVLAGQRIAGRSGGTCPDAEHLAQRDLRGVVPARPVHGRPGRGRGGGEVGAGHRRLVGVPARHRPGQHLPERRLAVGDVAARGGWGSTASIATAFFVTRSTTVSRKPGANRSIWFSMASVMSASEPCGTCT